MKLKSLVLVTFSVLFFGFSQDETSVFDGLPVPTDPNIMFYIQKNTNPNTIIYAIKKGSDGKINKNDPMEVFWRRFQEDGRKKKLGWLEKTFAFDFNVKPVTGKPNSYYFTIVALKKKRFYFTQNEDGEPVVATLINGKQAYIDRAYLTVDDTHRIQKVLAVEVFGRELKTNKFIYEKMLN